MDSSMFEKAARLKLRYDTDLGQLSVEDLWDLPLSSATTRKVSLDSIAIALDQKLKAAATTSFVKRKSQSEDSVTQLSLEIVVRVIEVLQQEAEAEEKKQENATKKQRLLELIAEKQDEALKGKSLEELQGLVESLS